MSADGDIVREALESFPRDHDPTQFVQKALDALARLEAAEARAVIEAAPTGAGGPGKEVTYWMRQKLQASIRHLRDIEDYFRFRGGLPGSMNEVRADRARQLYEAITEDFVNGNVTRPSRGDLEAQRDALAEALRWYAKPIGEREEGGARTDFGLRARAALAEAGLE